jgi:hypothetical protein
MTNQLQTDLFLGQLVEVTFWDHCWGDNKSEIIKCRVWGHLLKANWKRVIIQVWESDGSPTENAEYAVILRSTIDNIVRLERVGDGLND